MLSVGVSVTPERVNAQTGTDSSTSGQSSAAPDPSAVDDPEGLFPVAKLNESLPGWLRIGGRYRNRVEGPTWLWLRSPVRWTISQDHYGGA
jgi:hypothetical protein